jgi:UDP-glucose 4-epimerase
VKQPTSVLVTGGAGYIGSHMARRLLASGLSVVIVDNLSTGHAAAIPADVEFVHGDVRDRRRMTELLRARRIKTVFHFASRIQVGESVADPRLYWRDNLVAGIALIESSLDAGVDGFILSSPAAVYGNPARVPIDEEHPTRPVNAYGETKLALERMLRDCARAYGLRFVSLRYFNASGADADGCSGELHEPETHLIPLVLDVAIGRRSHVTIHGRDYDTPDGTCVRDYVHVCDLADAHLAAIGYLDRGGESGIFNLGTGRGHSVREIVEVARRVTGRDIAVRYGGRRPGDPPVLVASPARAARLLGWQPRRSNIDEIVRDAWAWHQTCGRPQHFAQALRH